MQSPWCVEAGRSQQIAWTRWFTQRSVLEAAANICANSDSYSRNYFKRRDSRFWRTTSKQYSYFLSTLYIYIYICVCVCVCLVLSLINHCRLHWFIKKLRQAQKCPFLPNLRVDVVLSRSRGSPGQWFPETECVSVRHLCCGNKWHTTQNDL